MKLTLSRPEHAEVISEFYRNLHGSEFAHEEMFSASTVAQLLRDEELTVVVASHQQKILGCGLAFLRPWNQSLEIGALSVVDDIPDRGEVGKALFEALRRLGMKNHGVVFFRARSESSFKRGRSIGASCWGFRPAPGSESVEDAELIMGFYNAAGQSQRVEPPRNIVTELPFAARVIEGIEAGEKGIPYPKSFPVGCPRGTGAVVISGRIWPTYHSRGNYINIENAAGNYPIEIIREFTTTVRTKGVRDVRLTLPVNQDEAFIELVDFGFQPVAYLPGWFLRGPHRFDCVELVTAVPRVPHVAASFLSKAVGKINEGFAIQV
ncbi:MAG: hypothetical protein H0U74_02800 [Bradymonadaceae bacterium]|nr:hypothetical protein [Lujinxingiaceae bacterium]